AAPVVDRDLRRSDAGAAHLGVDGRWQRGRRASRGIGSVAGTETKGIVACSAAVVPLAERGPEDHAVPNAAPHLQLSGADTAAPAPAEVAGHLAGGVDG